MDRIGSCQRTTPPTLCVEPVAHHETGWPAPPHFMLASALRAADRNLAEAAVAGTWQSAEVAKRLHRAMGTRPRGLIGLARRLLASFPDPPTAQQVLRVLRTDPLYPELPATIRQVFWSPAMMRPTRGWDVPTLRTTVELAHWLDLTVGELDWFADVQGRNPRQADPRRQHYTHRWVPKRGGRYRLLEIPKPRLKRIQRRILDGILSRIPPHAAAHGFRAGRSIKTFAEPHVGKALVWRIDLKDFFPSVPASRVHAIFRSAGYPLVVARALTGLCTTSLPGDSRAPDSTDVNPAFGQRHLPQGAPTSPALANLAAFRIDLRLASWAAECGATYTRYADDLAFSGGTEFARSGHRFRRVVFQVIVEAGFRPNIAKTRWMSPGGRQQLAGVVVNQRTNVRRDEYDRLKAILTNCVRHGPESQNREGRPDFRAYLLGRIAHIAFVNPARGQKLTAISRHIVWSSSATDA
jgi:RNA-directed DNA polymerase